MNKAYMKYFAALLLFGSNGIVASKVALSSYEIVFLRTMIGSLLLLGIFAVGKRKIDRTIPKKQWICLGISGVAMGMSWMFLYEAYQQIGVSMASLAYYCGPVIVMILSPALFREKLTWVKCAGFLIVLCGMVLVNGQAVAEGNNGFGVVCGAMSAVLYAFMVIFNKKAKEITGLENSMLQLFISFLTVAIFVWVKQGFYMKIAQTDVLPIMILGVFNTGLGCYLYFSSIGKLPVQTVAVCGYLEPLFAVIFSALLLKERLGYVQILGAAFILGGAIFGEMFGRTLPCVDTGED